MGVVNPSQKNPFEIHSKGSSLFTTSNPFGNTSTPGFGQTGSSFGQFRSSSTPTFAPSVTPAFGSSVAPAFGASGDLSLSFGPAISGKTSSYGRTSSLPSSGSDFSAFGTLTLSFGSSWTSCQTNTTTLGAPVFATGSAPNPAFGGYGTLTLTFGHNPGQSNFVQNPPSGTTAASGCAFSASGTLSLGFGPTSNLRQSDSTPRIEAQPSAFKPKTTFDSTSRVEAQPSAFQPKTTFGMGNYERTDVSDSVNSFASDSGGKLVSISAMPVYKDISHEELRWCNYKLEDKGDNVPENNFFSPFFKPKVPPSPFGITHIGTKDGCGNYQIGDRQVMFGVPPSANHFATGKSQSFRPFGGPTSPFGASTTPNYEVKDGCGGSTSQIAGSSWTFGGPSAQSPSSASLFGRPFFQNSDGCSSSTSQIAGSPTTFGSSMPFGSPTTFSEPSARPPYSGSLFGRHGLFTQTASSEISGGLSCSGVPKSESLSSTNPFGSRSTSITQTVTKEGEKQNLDGEAIKSDNPRTIYLT